MLNKREFDVLRAIFETGGRDMTQRVLAEQVGCSLGTVNSVLAHMREKGYVDWDYNITDAGMHCLAPYRVDNAVILAAGMSTRFIPISYELPKGLISVKGEVLIERLIRQLHEAGVNQIVLVLGYMMEKFLYLRDKYAVKFVMNNDYATKNTHSSVYVCRDYLCNTYIVSSDNYYPRNPFHSFEYRAYYCGVYKEGTSYDERGFICDHKGLIVGTSKPAVDQWIMYGHAYFDNRFSDRFVPLLERYFGRPGVENMYWENIYAENVKSLPMYIMKYGQEEILEFDSIAQLQAFDESYIANNRIQIFENICRVLDCRNEDIRDISVITEGITNRSFRFLCRGKAYVYRHPGVNSSNMIDRRQEANSLRLAKNLGIDNTLVYVDENEGWKISFFVDCTEPFDFSNERHIEMLADSLKKLHGAGLSVGYRFDYRAETERFVKQIRQIDALSWQRLQPLQDEMESVFQFLEADLWQVSLCHNDLYEPNLLVAGDRLELIDWEFAGDSDIGYDICKLFSVQEQGERDMDRWLRYYFGRETTEAEKLHLMACAAVVYYYWFAWGIYMSRSRDNVSGYMMKWYDRAVHYSREVIRRLGG